MRKFPYGMSDKIEWVGLDLANPTTPYPTWTCWVCKEKRSGLIIRACPKCGADPVWLRTEPFLTFWSIYLKRKCLRKINTLAQWIANKTQDVYELS